MDIWKILKVEKCKDKEVLVNAYREKLLITNPEDHPEEFKELRSAYEQALQYADSMEEEQELSDTSPEGLFMEQVKKIYHNFSDRLNIEKWRTLLNNDICYSLDTKIEIRNRLLTFFMECYRLPKEVWQLLDEIFHFAENKEELCELFPKDFIENLVMPSIEYPLSIKLELFEGPDDEDYDTFISYYFKATRAVDERNMDEVKETLDKMKELDIYHPYMDIIQIRIHLIEQSYQEARKIAEELYEKYRDDTFVILYMGETAFFTDKLTEAQKFYDTVLEEEPENFISMYGLASCFIKEEKFEEAKEALVKMLEVYPNNHSVLAEFESVNNHLIEKYEKERAEDKINVDKLHELAWCYLQNNKIQEGIALIQTFTPAHKDRFAYLNLCGRLYLANEEFEKALSYFKTWEEKGINLEDDGSEEVKKELGRKEFPIFLQSLALLGLKKEEEALACIERSLAVKREKSALFQKAIICYNMKRFAEGISICDELEQMDASFWDLYLIRGKCLYELRDNQEAFDNFNKALSLYAYSLDAYIYKIRILHNYRQYEQAQELLDYLEEQEVHSDRILVCRAQLMEAQDEKMKEKAQEIYTAVIGRCEEGKSDMDWVHQVYYLLAVSLENKAEAPVIFSYIDKGLGHKPDDTLLLGYKAYLYREYNRSKEAIACYEQILQIQPDHYNANSNLGYLYFKKKRYEEALPYFEHLLEISKDSYAYEMLGRTYLETGRFEEARDHLVKAIELDPEEANTYHFLAVAHMCLKDYEAAVESSKQTVKVMVKTENTFRNAYRLMAQNYSRLEEYGHALDSLNKNKEIFDDEENLKIMYMLMRKGEYQNAQVMLDKWYECSHASDKEITYKTECASIYIYMKQWKKAYHIIKKINQKSSEHILMLWGYHIMMNQQRKAIKIAKDFSKINPNNHMGYLLVARAGYRKGNQGYVRDNALESLKILDKLKDHVDDRAYYACERAICKVILGDPEGALAEIQYAKSGHLCLDCYGCECYEAHQAMAFYYESVGELEQAMQEYTKALSICKNSYKLVFEAEALRKRL